MFSVACGIVSGYQICAYPFLFLMMCIKKSLKGKRKARIPEKSYKMIFRLEHVEKISYVLRVIEIFESGMTYLRNKYLKG